MGKHSKSKAVISTLFVFSILAVAADTFSFAAPLGPCSPGEVFKSLLKIETQEFIGTFAPCKLLKEPFTGIRPRGLAAIREHARQHGITTVVFGARPKTAAEVAAFEFRYGTKVVFMDDFKNAAGITREKGVVLHPGEPVPLANVYRGGINPHMGYGVLHGKLSKWHEYEFADTVLPGLMPQSLRSDSLPSGKGLFFETNRTHLDGVIAGLNRSGGEIHNANAALLKQKLREFFHAADDMFPDGAFIKQIDEAATADSGKILTTFDLKAGVAPERTWQARKVNSLVSKYLYAVKKIRKEAGRPDLALDTKEFSEALVAMDVPEAAFVHKFLFQPKNIMIQKRIRLATTPQGHIMEFRVDFVDGEAVRSLTRHSREYLPKKAAEAEEVINSFFRSAPEEFRYLSGGADVAFAKNGKAVLIEFNFGSESWFIMASNEPVSANIYVSKILGRDTPLINELRIISKQPASAQREYMVNFGKKYDPDSVDGACLWLRDRMLERWSRNPTPETGKQVLNDVRALAYATDLDGSEVRDIITTTDQYIQRTLKAKGY